MKFYTQLYVGEQVKNLRRIKSRLRRGSRFVNAYVITFATGTDMLEIYNSRVLAQKYYRDFPKTIVGIAADYDEAVNLVIKITEETLKNRGDCDVKAYLTENMS